MKEAETGFPAQFEKYIDGATTIIGYIGYVTKRHYIF